MKNYIVIFTILFGFYSLNLTAQDAKKQKQEAASQHVKAAVDSSKFVFEAKSATPARGRLIQLTSGYNLVVTPREIKCDLPYFGRAFSGGYGSSDAGIKFTSTSFEYVVTPKKKGGWDITITPSDVSHVVKIFLSVTNSGNSTVRITSTDRDAISFNGEID